LLKEGETITLTNEEIEGDETKVSLTYKGLVDDVQIGNMILIDDGLIGMEVFGVENGLAFFAVCLVAFLVNGNRCIYTAQKRSFW